MRRIRKKGISAGTVLALMLTVCVTVSLIAVFRSIGGELDLSQVSAALQHGETQPVLTVLPGQPSAAPQQPSATLAPVSPAGGSFTLTAGGSLCLESGVRKSGYYADVKAYDFSEIFSLLGSSAEGDFSFVTMENLIDESAKVSDLIAPKAITNAIRAAGFQGVTLGFPKSLDKGASVLQSTVSAARSAGLQTLGFAQDPTAVISLNGVRVALLSYTDSLSSAGAKRRKNDGLDALLPSTERAAEDIAAARAAGAQVVIVSVSWGNAGKSSVTATQRGTALALAQAGADVILGTGTRTVQPACLLEGQNGRSTLCFYSLGTLLGDDRSNSQVAGMLLHLKVDVNAAGEVSFPEIACTPTYIWRYKQDGGYRYRVVASSHFAPSGMEESQSSAMERALSTVQTALGNEIEMIYR